MYYNKNKDHSTLIYQKLVFLIKEGSGILQSYFFPIWQKYEEEIA